MRRLPLIYPGICKYREIYTSACTNQRALMLAYMTPQQICSTCGSARGTPRNLRVRDPDRVNDIPRLPALPITDCKMSVPNLLDLTSNRSTLLHGSSRMLIGPPGQQLLAGALFAEWPVLQPPLK
jgi:hypothetical protein